MNRPLHEPATSGPARAFEAVLEALAALLVRPACPRRFARLCAAVCRYGRACQLHEREQLFDELAADRRRVTLGTVHLEPERRACLRS